MKNIAIILAAGMGKRMYSDKSKVLHEIFEKPMIEYVLSSLNNHKFEEIIVVAGHKKESLIEYFQDRVKFVFQDEQKGTAHAVMMAREYIKNNLDSKVVVLCGDTPLITTNEISLLLDNNDDYSATVLTTVLDDPTNYGRVIRDEKDEVVKIVEEKDANIDEKKVKEINSGMYSFLAKDLDKVLDKIKPNNSQKEYYLTDAIEYLIKDNKKVCAKITKDKDSVLGVNNKMQLSYAYKIINQRKQEDLMKNFGVTILDPNTTYISPDSKIDNDTIIYPLNTIINCEIGKDTIIYPNSYLKNSKIGDNIKIYSSYIFDSIIEGDSTIGPFAHIRNEAVIKKKAKIGNFVEVKKSIIEEGTKASHLTYLGDAVIGKKTNIGAGTITCNYDGKNKHKTIIGEGVFIGSNSSLVAPLNIEDNSLIAAGSTITKDVKKEEIAFGRARQINKKKKN
jgi:bifunctional UDP-N-acetylglucosamine pyrophosphorylase/glucosamine-1-phosphate N-acetyltransferase